jgi:uncharacterized protein involved in cysteine biosynthesis
MTTPEPRRVPPNLPHPVGTVSEVLTCLGLGVRDGIRPRLALTSVLAALLAFGIWLAVFLVWRSDIWAMAGAITQGIGSWIASLVWPDAAGQAASGASSGMAWGERILSSMAGTAGGLLTFLVFTGIFLLLIILTIRILLELFLMRRVQQQCLTHYPGLQSGVKGNLRVELLSMLAIWFALCGGVLFLVIPVIGGAFFFVLASYLNIRSLVHDALDGLATVEERRRIIVENRPAMLLLGVAVSALMLIPFVGFLMPAVLGASTCHLCIRALQGLHSSGH